MTEMELLQAIYANTQELQKDVQDIKSEISELKEKVNMLEKDVSVLKEEVSILKKDVSMLKEDVQDLKRRVSALELTLENETNPGIRIIGEGHTDLSRKLDEALKVENEREILLLRVNHLETELRMVKGMLSA